MKRQLRATIQAKILGLAIAGLIICTLAFGGLCLHTTDKVVYEGTEKNLHSLTSIETIKLNNRLKSVEQYVNTLNIAITGMLDSIEQLTDEKLLADFTEKSRELIRLTIGNTEKAVSAYLRFNPKLAPPTSGVFMAMTATDHELRFTEPTDFSKYSPEDTEHVGWYYNPIRTKRPMWMKPYLNKNIGIYMISYVIPIFKFDKEIGVVGVDIDFDYLTREIAAIRIFDNDYAFLADRFGNILFHPSIPKGHQFTPPDNSLIIHNRLANGMDLTFVIPKTSISANRDNLIKNLILITMLILVAFIFASSIFASTLTKSIKLLTDYANRLIDGKMGIKLNIKRNDEIGDLAKSFVNAKIRLAETMGEIKGLAFRDPITNVRNRNSLDHYINEFNIKVSSGEIGSYGVLVTSIDNLFKIKNKFGNPKAITLLQTASKLICSTFDHSPVFRVNDDEFVIILMNNDLNDHENLQKKLKESAQKTASAENPWEQVMLSIGTSICKDAQSSSLSEQLVIAENDMLKDRKEIE
ncbi:MULTISPECIES: diguanylate cyclase domain-containing protein [Fibrobacter]|uniref:diguanylate cyclase domain-containing protein n=1 Tax=Fibrobacter TaxID=832 RepID=UPI000B52406A|nr:MULTISPECIES: diguanylate cyclase [Fibrobacter]MBO4828612.1 diguanylate cyclase [Fibrobacter sp.]OWV17989.1 diguanylate cyclase [Fibrobacter sp. UWB4]